ncbi:MAG: hypothetical protein M0R00_08150, partial [Candidatus Omnitrophica bacterium]|nr:hypothetical protein [Candidatus Omnitrophota bacterium]
MEFIKPIAITDAILTGSNVQENDYAEWVARNILFAALSQTTRDWFGMAAAPNGNVYACVLGGGIYMQTAGSGAFVALGQTTRDWFGMCAAPNGNVYACVYNGDIYMQTGGSGAFVALNQTARAWYGMCAAPNGNVYASVNNGDIYMQTGGSGAFFALGQTIRDWRGMCVAPNGNVYACVASGDIYMQTGGSGAFVALSQTVRNWFGMAAAPNGNVYANVYNGDIYMQTGGSGAFVALGQSARYWYGMCAAPNGNVYACVWGGDIYKQSSAGLYFTDDYVIVTTPNIHNIYQSLTDNNANNYPVNDNVNWLKIGSTNRWKTFNAIIGSQTEQATKIEYILTPSEAIDSVALLNIDSDTVEITEIDTTEALLNETAWTGATGTTQSTGWNKVGTPSDYTIDGGMIRITADAASEGQSKTVAVTPGVEYQLLGLYKNNLGDTAQYGIYDNTHSSNILATTDLPSSTTNASFSHVFTAPAGCTSIEIKQMAKANTDVVWFDSFILAPTKYSETVTTGPSKIDVVKLDIPEISTGILTVVINKTPNGNVYACVWGGDIYMQTGGSGAFVALGQSARNWVGMCAAPNGNVYACVYNGDIYMQTGGSGAFVALNQSARDWRGMCAAPNGNVYACVASGDIYMQTGGSGAFVAL